VMGKSIVAVVGDKVAALPGGVSPLGWSGPEPRSGLA
jgi:hypothetical protein